MSASKRAAIYLRVSTDKQTVDNQEQALRQIAEHRGWTIVARFDDNGISGSKSRKERPGLDQMLKDAQRRSFDVVMAWAIDRLGRSPSICSARSSRSRRAASTCIWTSRRSTPPRRPASSCSPSPARLLSSSAA